MSNSLETDSKARDIAFLDNYAMSRWRCVLHYMVGAGGIKDQDFEGISPDAARILLNANLLKNDDTDGATITRQGFQFLLLDTQTQVWHFMLEYLDSCEQRGMVLSECLSMLFQLSFSTLGRDYSSEGLSQNLLTFLQHLREFGLVYQRKVNILDRRITCTDMSFHIYWPHLFWGIAAEGRSILSNTAGIEYHSEAGYSRHHRFRGGEPARQMQYHRGNQLSGTQNCHISKDSCSYKILLDLSSGLRVHGFQSTSGSPRSVHRNALQISKPGCWSDDTRLGASGLPWRHYGRTNHQLPRATCSPKRKNEYSQKKKIVHQSL